MKQLRILSLLTLLLTAMVCAGENKSAAPGQSMGKGSILAEFYRGVGGNSVAELTKDPSFPASPTDGSLLTLFEIPTDADDNYGTRVSGFIYPPFSGQYTFWIASDDNSELWLSTSENPKEKVKIAQVNGWTPPRAWDTTPEQKSKPVSLYVGRKYYIEALHKEGSGGDNLAVGWQMPDGKQERPIPGERLSPSGLPKIIPTTVKIIGDLPKVPGHHKLKAEVSGPGLKMEMPFLIYLPLNYDTSKDKWPMVLFLHGAGECGTDHNGLFAWGPTRETSSREDFRQAYPMMTFSPQCTPGRRWDQPPVIKAVIALLDEVTKSFNVDADRVYVTGLSMGGIGTWHMAREAPERFAAVVPLDARALDPDTMKVKLKNTPVWIIAGGNDGDFTAGSQLMFKALENSAFKPALTLVPNCGHGAWGYYYPKIDFYQWLLKWRRGMAPPPPAPAAGPAASPAAGPKTGSAESAKVAAEPAKSAPEAPKEQPKAPTETPRIAAVPVVKAADVPAQPEAEAPRIAPAPAVKLAEEAAKVAAMQPQKAAPDTAPVKPATTGGVAVMNAAQAGLSAVKINTEPTKSAEPSKAVVGPSKAPATLVAASAEPPKTSPAPAKTDAQTAAAAPEQAAQATRLPYVEVTLTLAAALFGLALYLFFGTSRLPVS